MSGNITGIVQEVNNNGMGKGSNIVVNGQKYGCYDPVKTGIDVVAVGDEVSLGWAQKGQYINIMGRVNKTGNTGAVLATPVTGTTAAANAAVVQGKPPQGGGNPEFQFPIPALNYQRSVVRRDAVTQATTLIVGTGNYGDDPFATAAVVLDIARVFEAYEAGDIDEKEAADAVAALSAVNQ